MSNVNAFRVVSLVALVACNSSSQVTDGSVNVGSDSHVGDSNVDAPAGNLDFTCTSNPAPTTSIAQVTVSGTAQEVSLGAGGPVTNPLDDATLVACKQPGSLNCGLAANQYGSAMTDSQGAFSLGPISTSAAPLDIYLDMTADGSRRIFAYPPQPLVGNPPELQIMTFSPLLLQFGSQFGCPQHDENNGIIYVRVTDCADKTIGDTANTKIVIKQGGNVVTGTNIVDLSSQSPEAAGSWLICNVPANAVTSIGATYKGMNMLAHDVKVVAGTSTETSVRPGYY